MLNTWKKSRVQSVAQLCPTLCDPKNRNMPGLPDHHQLLKFTQDSQESSPTPQFKSINSSALSFLYSPTLTSIHEYWRNDSFD